MPSRLKRFHQSGQTHFVTFSCFQRKPFFTTAASKSVFEAAVERARQRYRTLVYGYVVMPEHVHLLLSEPETGKLADAIKAVKQSVSRRLIGEREHFWQKRYYDFNVRTEKQFVEKLRYIHRNPAKRGLCELPEHWNWSSFRHYATGEVGTVTIESEWTARMRERIAERLHPLTEPLPHSSQKKA